MAVALNGQEAGNGPDPGADGRLHANDLGHPSESHLVIATAHHEPASATATVGETAKVVGTPSRPIGSDVPGWVGPEPRDGKHAGSATAISEALLDPPVAVQVADGRQLDTIRARGDQLARLLAHPQDAAELLAGWAMTSWSSTLRRWRPRPTRCRSPAPPTTSSSSLARVSSMPRPPSCCEKRSMIWG